MQQLKDDNNQFDNMKLALFYFSFCKINTEMQIFQNFSKFYKSDTTRKALEVVMKL